MINPDSVNSLAAAMLPARGDSGNGEQQRAAWMLQMERALLAANQVRVTPDQAQAGMQGATPASGKAAESGASREKNREPQDSNASAVAGTANAFAASKVQLAAREPDSAAAQADDATRFGAATSASAGSGNTSARTMQTPQSAQTVATAQTAQSAMSAPSGAQADEDAGSATDGSPGGTGAYGNAAGNGLPNDALLSQPLPASAMTALAAGMLPALNPYQSVQADGQSAALNLPLTAVRAAAPAGLWALTQATLQTNAQGKPLGVQAGDAEVAESPAARFEAPETEPFAERKLHLYQGADGVQAWIRDADLNQMRAHLVAQALNNELNAAGLKLKTLTVNGRKLDSGSQSSSIEDSAEDSNNTLTDAVLPELRARGAIG